MGCAENPAFFTASASVIVPDIPRPIERVKAKLDRLREERPDCVEIIKQDHVHLDRKRTPGRRVAKRGAQQTTCLLSNRDRRSSPGTVVGFGRRPGSIDSAASPIWP
jgi:hypothetical protein